VADFLAHRVAFLIQTHPTLATALDDQKLYVTYVPSHRIRRYRVKGYNQSLLLAQALSKILTLSLVSPLLKTKITLTQTGLSRFQRLKNLRHAFTLQNINHNTLPEDATLVIIDDVTTT
jgi:predicted amidophosphoribosyltransferase